MAGYIKLFMRLSLRSCSRHSKGSISGIVLRSLAPRYLFKQSRAERRYAWKRTQTRTP